MTRRLAASILLIVWFTITAAGVGAFLTARAVLLSELDASIVRRALLLPQIAGDAGRAAWPDDRFVVVDALNHTLARPAASSPARRLPEVTGAAFVELPEGEYRRLTLRFPATVTEPAATLVYSAPAAEYRAVLLKLAGSLTAFAVAGAVLAAFAAARIARLVLRPLAHTARTIGEVDPAHLDRRIDAAALPPELRPVAEKLNGMLGRLESAFEQRRRFLADASHELRTPVAALVTTLEVALRRPRGVEEMVRTSETCLTEARHLRELVAALMRQVRADRPVPAGDRVPFDVGRLVDDCVALMTAEAAERGVRLTRSGEPRATALGDPDRLRSAILNLLGNAIEYSGPDGSVDVSVTSAGSGVSVTVRDTGPGIAAEHLPHVFEPFYRAAGDRPTEGHLGLGLFLVRTQVLAMGGRVEIDSQPGRGTALTIHLAPPPAGPG